MIDGFWHEYLVAEVALSFPCLTPLAPPLPYFRERSVNLRRIGLVRLREDAAVAGRH